MNLKRTKIYSVLLALLLCTSARATTHTFVDWDLQDLNAYRFLSQGKSYTGTWDISNDPNWSSSLDITSIATDFWFADDGDADTSTKWVSTGYYTTKKKKWGKTETVWVSTGGYYDTVTNNGNLEKVDITVDDVLVADDFEVDGTVNYFTNLASYDLLSYDHTAILSIHADLSEDGILTYIVTAVKGDTYLKESRLTVYADEPYIPSVPDAGSTLALLGAGLAGLCVIRRRR